MANTRTVKARKTYKCGRCRKVINPGDEYLRCEPAYMPAVIRCNKCGIRFWETTTSDYIQDMGRLQELWEEDYGCSSDAIDEIKAAIEEKRDELQDRLDNMPEGLQQGDAGQMLQERIDGMEYAISDLESIDCNEYQADENGDLDEEKKDELCDEIMSALENLCF